MYHPPKEVYNELPLPIASTCHLNYILNHSHPVKLATTPPNANDNQFLNQRMAYLYGASYYPIPAVPELADHMHENLHQHNTFLGAMAHRKPNQKTHPNHLDVDISDNDTYYLVDLEVPGIKDPNAVALNWSK